ncbi:uncharacterized protein M421DRAFT_56458 [Didymella exigua CBS 183.55]|uniref:Uncharacterized protein n=1 Tax=Didymella exigua CBS 183.55 TaxID=1150837 RepID=A0A6A5RVE5_9PLEO|nr:uncharacterized protein M421DRAFT_56458 [Didymella exigua CBS 183.55]KAF1931330.1 hypothetical protein M421DRAFT_56458 [Didymella exigua CBS 183.55]
MALRCALAALAIAAGVNAQTTDNSNFYSLTDDYYYGNTKSSTRTSMFWTATIRYVPSVSEKAYTYTYGEPSTTTYRYTDLATIKPTVTPTVTPTSTYLTSYYYSNVAVVEEYYATGAVAESDISTYDGYDYSTATASTRTTYSSIEYYMPVTMTAPASCPTIFTVATQAEITDVPSIVAPQLKPASTEVSVSSGRSYDYEIQTWWLTEGAAPFTSTDDIYYSYYIASCTPPPARSTAGSRNGDGSGSGTGSSSGSDDDSWYDYRMCYFSGCTSVKTWIIILATVLPGIFLLGFFESWFWYTRLMKGKSAMRCGTVCWILLSLWVLCFTRMQDARSKEDQKALQQQWKEMPAGKKFKNWSWGFRRRYPVPILGQFSRQTVGIVPEGQPLHPAMAQAPPGQVFYYGHPPGAPGWQQGPNGGAPGYAMQQGYLQQGGYYAAHVPKGGVVVGSQSVPGTATSQGTATPPQAPQPMYHPPTSLPTNAQLPPLPQQAPLSVPGTAPPAHAPSAAAAPAAVSAPPANVSEAPAKQTRETPATETAPAPAATQAHPTHPAPAKNETNDDLYK